MTISIISLFPDSLRPILDSSITKRAQQEGHVQIHLLNLRDFATDRYKTVDDHPYGGGAGMVLRVDVVDRAISAARLPHLSKTDERVMLLDPQGTPFTQHKAQRLATAHHLILFCAHYEGVDERIRSLVDEELSIGDYILTGGELAALVVADAVIRLIPGVINPDSLTHESFEKNLLEYPHYTRPEQYHGVGVPPILLSGNHAKIAQWRTEQANLRTRVRRPDLLKEKTQ